MEISSRGSSRQIENVSGGQCKVPHSVVVAPHSDYPRNVETICERTLPKGRNEPTNKMNDNNTEPDNLFSWTPYNYNREWSKLNMTGHDSSDEPSSDESSSDGYDSDESDDFSTDEELTSDNEEPETFEEPEEPASDNYDADDDDDDDDD